MERKEYYKQNRERILKRNRAWTEANKERDRKNKKESYHRKKNNPKNIKHYLVKYAKARAAKKEIEFSITEEDINLPEICPIMKVPFNKDTRKYGYSLDRIDPTKGYTKDNIWVISQIANAMKWDSSPEERIKFANWVLSLEGG